ncbi:MAG: class I SAM-dependent methyltransferase [Flavonifractor plautii]
MTPPASAAMPVGCTRCCWSRLAQIPHGSVLDVGRGTGEPLREVGLRFPETARTGLDLSANMLAVAREKLGGAVELVQGDAERLPFADGRFEVPLCNDSFHHYPNPGAAAAEFARVLQPGGVLLLGDCTAPAGPRGWPTCSSPCPARGTCASTAGRSWPLLLEPHFHGVEFRRVGRSSLLVWGFGKQSTGPPHMRRARAGYSSMAK